MFRGGQSEISIGAGRESSKGQSRASPPSEPDHRHNLLLNASGMAGDAAAAKRGPETSKRPALSSHMRRTLTVILASDVAGYSRLVADREEETIERFRRAAAVFSDLVKKHQGSVFNTAGDAILARFDSAVDATRCAIDIQDANNAQNAETPPQEKLLFRIGIAIGDVLVAENGDLLGDAVNIAARLENIAEPGGICISDDVRSQVLNKIRLNVVDLGGQNLRNIPRTIRVFKLIPNSQPVSEPRLRQSLAARIPTIWLVAGIALLGAVSVAAPVWYLYPSPKGSNAANAEQPFDPSKVPLVTDRARESLSNYGREPDFKAIAISREALGVGFGAPDIETAKREALDRCQQRDQKGFCRIYAVGNKVHWSKAALSLPADTYAEPLDVSLTQDDAALTGRLVPGLSIDGYLTAKNHKALAVSRSGYWSTGNRASQAEAARLAVERCTDIAQAPCLLLSLDGLLVRRLPRSHHVTQPFTLAGENEMADADKERIGKIYIGKDWRAIARGGSKRWYAVANADSEAAAAEQVLKACRDVEQECTLHAIGSFRVGDRKD